MVICRNEEEEKRRESKMGGGGNKITKGGVLGLCRTSSTVEDVDRESRVHRGKSSLGLSVPVQGSDCNSPPT